MRIVVCTLLATVVAAGAAAVPGHVVAKTYIGLTPGSGPTGSMVQVSGFGFATGEVRIALAPLDAVEGGFLDSLPEDQMVTLADAVAAGGEVDATVVLPGARGFSWGKQVDILAIQEDPPTSDLKFFVAKATFNVTALRDLPTAGYGPDDESGGMSAWLALALAVGGALVACTGLCLRRVARG